MAKVINLSRARKSRARGDKRQQGAENAVKFGRGKGEKLRDTTTVGKLEAHLDQHKIDDKTDL